MGKTKVCFAASSGGHLEELSRLASLAKEGDFVFTEKSNFSTINWCNKVNYVSQINRKEPAFIFKFIGLCLRSLALIIKEKPDVVISTGALATYPVCLIAKILRKKVIYIESFARVDNASLTGKLLYKIADVFIVQWEEMLAVYPDAIYAGGIF